MANKPVREGDHCITKFYLVCPPDSILLDDFIEWCSDFLRSLQSLLLSCDRLFVVNKIGCTDFVISKYCDVHLALLVFRSLSFFMFLASPKAGSNLLQIYANLRFLSGLPKPSKPRMVFYLYNT